MSATFSVSNSLLHICLNSSSCHNVLILLSLSGVTNLSLLVSVCATCIPSYRCFQMKWWAVVTVVVIPSQKALLMCPYVSSGKFSVLASSRALLHNLQFTSDRCLIFASHWVTWMIPAIAIIFCLLCLQGTHGLFKYLPKNALLSFCRNMKSAVHVPCAGWLLLSCSASSHTWFQEFPVINPSVLLQDLHHALIRFLITLLVYAGLYVITFAPLFISSPECAHLSPSTCKLLFMFLHLILCCLSPYWMSHAII